MTPRHLILPLLFAACAPAVSERAETVEQPEHETLSVDSSAGEIVIAPEDTAQYATFYVVLADTGKDYFALRDTMFALQQKLNLPVDTMGRLYNREKDLIALPDNDEDEMYAGDYFPRRFPSAHMSLEYLTSYRSDAGEKTIALLTGIFETAREADSALTILKSSKNNAFSIRSQIYVGCMH